MAYHNQYQLDQSLKENSKDFRQSWGLNHVTSTPIYKRSGIGKLNSTRRYSLASVAQSPLVKPTKHSGQKNHSFDLSKKFDSYMSTHIDTQSPGYSSRVVQYSQENEKPTNSHLRQYGLGSFPIVHFFKKDLPVLKRKYLHVNDSINSAELSGFNSPEHNKLLLERIIRSRSENGVSSSHKSEVNTNSVLDALREISRKRIHSDEEEFNLRSDGKRMCLDFDNEINARSKLDQKTLQENFRPNIKGMIDELTASYSSSASMEYEHVTTPPKKKSIAISTPPRLSPEKSKVKECVDVQTQTLVVPSIVTSLPEEVEDSSLVKEKEQKVKRSSPVRIFDDKPLESMRKKKLSILMGSYTKEKTEDIIVETKETTKEITTAPVSILTTSKSPQKVVKHVTFNLPESTSDASISSETTSNSSTACVVTNTTTSLITPIVFPNVSESSPKVVVVGTTQSNTPNISTSYTLKSAVNDALVVGTTSIQNTFTLGSTDSVKSAFDSSASQSTFVGLNQNIITEAPQNVIASVPQSIFASVSRNTFASVPQRTIANVPQNTTSSTPQSIIGATTPQKTVGGFRFDLKEAKMPNFPQPSTTSLFPIGTTSNNTNSPISFPVLAAPSASLPFAPPNVVVTTSAFALPSTTGFSLVTFPPSTFNNTPAATTTTASSTSGFNFSSNLTSTSAPFTFSPASTVATTIPKNLPPLYPNYGINAKPAFPPIVTISPAQFTSDPTPAITTPFNLQQSNSSVNLTGPLAFNKVDTNFGTSSIFETSKNTPVATTSAPVFGVSFASTVPAKPMFEFATNSTATTIAAVPTPKNNIFGNFAPPTTTSIPAFGTQPPAFGTTSSQFSFNSTAFKPNPSPFGNTKTEIPVTTASTASFIQSNNTFSSTFGTGGGIFDKPGNSTTQEVVPFGNATNNAFGNNNFTMKPQPTQTAEVFSFGTTNAKPAVFSFGASEPPKPTFNFGGADNSNVFGGGNKGFGNGVPPPAFGGAANVPPNMAGMFNIGTGGSATPTRARTQLKARRRT